MSKVSVSLSRVDIPTYEPCAPEVHPMFLEKRVYQGSSGKVYPLPFTGRIAETKTPRSWQAITLENEFLEVLLLPEIGGRIHACRDKTNGYDLFYRQNVIKPALVGLAGPWCSGGVEFNWPQHHRPATFMPVEHHIEHGDDGSITVWLSDHDPMSRMKGMHGVCLHPGKAYLELKVRAYNRTQQTQTFLWWANVATRVHEQYQSFFPPDVNYVADHAKRAMSEFPLCQDRYYGVDYGARARDGVPRAELPADFVPPGTYAANDLSWYANIPVPTSYMAMGSQEDFFGGYDHARQAGLVHIANHHISPGKKQWTWGNHEFGYAWDRHLTDEDGPYIELMAGVYTDNQPDFSFLMPGETKTWSQFWYPIRDIGPARHANLDAALNLVLKDGSLRFGVSVTSRLPQSSLRLFCQGREIFRRELDLAPDHPYTNELILPLGAELHHCRLELRQGARLVITHQPAAPKLAEVPPPATEPPAPEDIPSNDELYITGLHLEQYRHATRCPTLYWREALRRDPGDSRCLTALGQWHFKRGEFALAEEQFRGAIARLTRRNPNPADGEALYQLGLTLRFLGRDREAYDAFYKAAWNMAWMAPAYHALAEIDASRGEWSSCVEHLKQSLRFNTDNLRARNLLHLAHLRLGQNAAAAKTLVLTLEIDPLDAWARFLKGDTITDAGLCLDIALDLRRAGLIDEALAILRQAQASGVDGLAPLLAYHRAALEDLADRPDAAAAARAEARAAKLDYCFPFRLEDLVVLEAALAAEADDARAAYLLGNLLYDKRRHREAIDCWQRAVFHDATQVIAWRNLGIGAFNVLGDRELAQRAYAQALALAPADARLLYERDQLAKRCSRSPAERLAGLECHRDLIASRDDLSLEFATLLNQSGRHAEARELIASRHFQPWEGGEGLALGQFVRCQVMLGREALSRGEASTARACFEAALRPPQNLGEAKHLLANHSDIFYWLGCACEKLGDLSAAKAFWSRAADFKGDFQDMAVRSLSEMTLYSALSLKCLSRADEAEALLLSLLAYAVELEASPAKIDYFATSLPTLLLFDEDLQERQITTARFLRAQAFHGLGRSDTARELLREVLSRDPNHALARDLAQASF